MVYPSFVVGMYPFSLMRTHPSDGMLTQSLAATIFRIILYEIHLHIRSAFLFELRKSTFMIEEFFKCSLSMIYRLGHCF